MFHDIQRFTPEETDGDGDTREVIGDGTEKLRVPGLTKILGVRVGKTTVPLDVTHQFPVNTNFAASLPMSMPLIRLDQDEDGCPVVLRALQSNDGLWQKGEKIVIRGEFNTAPEKDEITAKNNRVTKPGDAKQPA